VCSSCCVASSRRRLSSGARGQGAACVASVDGRLEANFLRRVGSNAIECPLPVGVTARSGRRRPDDDLPVRPGAILLSLVWTPSADREMESTTHLRLGTPWPRLLAGQVTTVSGSPAAGAARRHQRAAQDHGHRAAIRRHRVDEDHDQRGGPPTRGPGVAPGWTRRRRPEAVGRLEMSTVIFGFRGGGRRAAQAHEIVSDGGDDG
jgi:hypothetical protein